MIEQLKSLRALLEADPNSIIAGKLSEPVAAPVTGAPKSYAPFLSISDGARFGVIDIFGSEQFTW